MTRAPQTSRLATVTVVRDALSICPLNLFIHILTLNNFMVLKRKHSFAALEEERVSKRQLRSGRSVYTSPQPTKPMKPVQIKLAQRAKVSPNRRRELPMDVDMVDDHTPDTKGEIPQASNRRTPLPYRGRAKSPSLDHALSDETNFVRIAGNEIPQDANTPDKGKRTTRVRRPKPDSAQNTLGAV